MQGYLNGTLFGLTCCVITLAIGSAILMEQVLQVFFPCYDKFIWHDLLFHSLNR
jgi:hypothetical protein